MTGLIVSRSICLGGAVGPILRIFTAAPGADTRTAGALFLAFVVGALLFDREIRLERTRLAEEEE